VAFEEDVVEGEGAEEPVAQEALEVVVREEVGAELSVLIDRAGLVDVLMPRVVDDELP
jgi:hypothetical protein